MPYNTTAIPPRREPTGHTQLPPSSSLSVSKELFIQYLSEQAHNVVKSERKPRRNIQYRDLSNAVARNDNLEFLSDVVPRTVPYKQVKEKKTGITTSNGDPTSTAAVEVEPGQTTLDGKRLSLNTSTEKGITNGTGMNGLGIANGDVNSRGGHHTRQSGVSDVLVEDGPNAQLQMEIRDAREHGANGRQGGSQDVEMS
ncbi:hypothetical protein B7463_g4269, partial [Scytalidium lignicola]